jgi:hypothetical protein
MSFRTLKTVQPVLSIIREVGIFSSRLLVLQNTSRRLFWFLKNSNGVGTPHIQTFPNRYHRYQHFWLAYRIYAVMAGRLLRTKDL